MRQFKIMLGAFILVLLMLPVSAITFSAEENAVWDGKIAEAFAGGTGTEEDPYIIQTASQLAFLSKSISLGTSSYEEEYIKLENDIVLNVSVNWEHWNTTAPANWWTPIGNSQGGFRGNFDGGGHTVSGVYINSESDCLGLFGYIGSGGYVANIGVINSYVTGGSNIGGVVGYLNAGTVSNCYYTGTVNGDCAVGGVVGYALSSSSVLASISNCYNTGAITGTGILNGGIAGSAIHYTISNCCNTGIVSGIKLVGGIAGYMHTCTISNCYNNNTVSGTTKYVGGIAGWAISSPIDNCYNTGTISGYKAVGGIAGDVSSYSSVSGTVKNCYSTGNISGKKRVGGVAGWSLGTAGWFTPGTVSNCYYLKATASGGINSIDVSDKATALTDAQLKNRDAYADWNFLNVWEFGGDDLNYDYPTLIGVEHREAGNAVPAA